MSIEYLIKILNFICPSGIPDCRPQISIPLTVFLISADDNSIPLVAEAEDLRVTLIFLFISHPTEFDHFVTSPLLIPCSKLPSFLQSDCWWLPNGFSMVYFQTYPPPPNTVSAPHNIQSESLLPKSDYNTCAQTLWSLFPLFSLSLALCLSL